MKQAENISTSLGTLTDERELSDYDVYLFMEGTHCRLYDKLGASPTEGKGVHFAVWAPNAKQVCVVGDFNNWSGTDHPMTRLKGGIWTTEVTAASLGDAYAFLVSSNDGSRLNKSDPFAVCTQSAPEPKSVIWDLKYEWSDRAWMKQRTQTNLRGEPVSVYEVYLPGWRKSGKDNRPVNCREIAPSLADYATEMGFTHVELLPVMEHHDPETWGYKTTAFFAPSRRYGSPQDLMFLIDHLHQKGLGVILDWSPAHFAPEDYSLSLFDGSHLFEHPDPRRGYHPQWTSYIFNCDRPEVRSFLLSVGFFWLEKYHADGFRIDAVTSMLYLDFARAEWLPNEKGGRDNPGAIVFIRDLNQRIRQHFPGVETFAEESTDWARVSHSTADGLGFGFKWDMGWENDILRYLSRDPIYRKYHHRELTFRACYYAQENFLLPLSHDDVSHEKGSLVSQMPGDYWEKLASLRLLLGYMFALPGKKLVFMGTEFGNLEGWRFERYLNWTLLSQPTHRGILEWVKDLNNLYVKEPALYETDCIAEGFEWIDCHDNEKSIVSFLRKPLFGNTFLLAIFNFTPVLRTNYRIGVPKPGLWTELLNSDSTYYGGLNNGNFGEVSSDSLKWHDREHSICLTVPPLSALIFKHVGHTQTRYNSQEIF